MSETTPLSALCSICHSQAPKYKCPGCGARTCSLDCVKKHKVRADCSGKRNPAAYIPLEKLRTEAGIDHDYNFLHSIERAIERAEKDIIEERRILNEKELRPVDEDRAFRKIWIGEELRHIPVEELRKKRSAQNSIQKIIPGFDKQVRRRLRELDIDVIVAPSGLSRHKENKTCFYNKDRLINWQVEWLIYGTLPVRLTFQPQQQPHRILYRTLESNSLANGLAGALQWWHRGQTAEYRKKLEISSDYYRDDDAHPNKRRKIRQDDIPFFTTNALPFPAEYQHQDFDKSTWSPAPYTTQDVSGAWSNDIPAPYEPPTLESALTTCRFFLAFVERSKPNQKLLLPVAANDNFTNILAGRTVIEFPTIHAVAPGVTGLPAGWSVVDGPRGQKRAPENGNSSGPSKKPKADADSSSEAEEGEVDDDFEMPDANAGGGAASDEDDDSDNDSTSSTSNSSESSSDEEGEVWEGDPNLTASTSSPAHAETPTAPAVTAADTHQPEGAQRKSPSLTPKRLVDYRSSDEDYISW
ncbi:uncharacterized protein CTHT_0004710 [Thermochaetoides thermophila DSM 1495]|uniref:Box C/D snoRNA protein 1 n=1 Tax=Chaetomium thermophilum (strain DSM 1495 / CBS 144.50 / IMI 039719) TaxID=759272 RepID=G0RXY3_CHATD|nr:hypothetical protein CTHT_0004710 [Thermochaetoides thermophila DSM 1495]EGS23769.1 hypothetical protein CTHT_0004710 [Thermochaetoides thermophila DSM 1495]